jgi:hypothetical protein
MNKKNKKQRREVINMESIAKVNVSFWADFELAAAIKEAAYSERKTVSEMIRSIVNEHLTRKEETNGVTKADGSDNSACTHR